MMDRVAERGIPSDRDLGGTAPVTDSDSKSVMLRAERNDQIRITEVVKRFDAKSDIPTEVSVLQRNQSYYGPNLLLHAELDREDCNFRLTAPGPDTYLYLWGAQSDEGGFRETWYKIAEVKAVLPENQQAYDICSECGEPIQSLEHERYAAFGQCPGVDT